MKKLLFLVIAIIMSSVSIPVACGEPESTTTTTTTPWWTPTGIDFIVTYDKDGDGKVSKEEYPNEDFIVYDKNDDGFIILDEVSPQEALTDGEPTAGQIAFIVKYDKDEDGKVSNEEFTGVHFPIYDRNGNGFIEPLEAPKLETAY